MPDTQAAKLELTGCSALARDSNVIGERRLLNLLDRLLSINPSAGEDWQG